MKDSTQDRFLEPIYYEAQEDTPRVVLDAEKGIFEIEGSSLTDVGEFYSPILDWLDTYKQAPNPSSIFTFKLGYFNTGNGRALFYILSRIEEIENAAIHWCYQHDDEDMMEAGQEFADLIEVPFEYVAYY